MGKFRKGDIVTLEFKVDSIIEPNVSLIHEGTYTRIYVPHGEPVLRRQHFQVGDTVFSETMGLFGEIMAVNEGWAFIKSSSTTDPCHFTDLVDGLTYVPEGDMPAAAVPKEDNGPIDHVQV